MLAWILFTISAIVNLIFLAIIGRSPEFIMTIDETNPEDVRVSMTGHPDLEDLKNNRNYILRVERK